ncbi:MAG: DUF1573 domain-containing protein [Spirochaetes bacterium]|nr:MAG: DUF1573 domain-containing protein [Spirochaetota bacterium]
MKIVAKISRACLFACIAVFLNAACDAPRIQFAEQEFDFGTVAPKAALTHVFTFRNTGAGTLTITKVSPG